MRIFARSSLWLCSFVVLAAVQVRADSGVDGAVGTVLYKQTLAIALQGVEVGKVVARDVQTKDGIEITRDATLQLARGTTQNRISTTTRVKLTRDFKPISFTYTRTDASGTMTLEGKVENGTLVLAGSPSSSQPFPSNATFALGLEHETRRNLKDGLHVERTVVLEEMAALSPMTVDVKKHGDGFTITSSFQGLVTQEEVDQAGNTIVARTPGVGIVAYPPGHAPPDLMKGNADLLSVSTWKVQPVHMPATSVTYRITVKDAAQFQIPEDARQKITKRAAEAIEVTVKAGPTFTGALSAERRTKALSSTPYEAVTDPAIVKAAADATKSAKDKRDEVELLTHFVYSYVEKKGLDRGYAPATATLQSKAGDCTEHSVLLSALLRARGIPTRLVDGVVVDQDRAGYHEWVEAYLDGTGFVPADPTFGQFPAGPERLKLAEGSTSPDEHLQLSLAAARLLGQKVTLEVVASQ